MQYTRALFKGILESFGIKSGSPMGEEAWVDNDAALTEREKLMRQITTIFQWGAIVNGLVLLLLLLVLAFGTISPSQIAGILLAGLGQEAGTITLLGLLAIGANISLLLLLSARLPDAALGPLALLSAALRCSRRRCAALLALACPPAANHSSTPTQAPTHTP